MAFEGGTKDDVIKMKFAAREGMYKQMPVAESFYLKRPPFAAQAQVLRATEVKTSFVKIFDGDEEEECICFTVGKELFYFSYEAFKQSKPLGFVDKRNYKGASPSCHDINQFTVSNDSVKIAVGFVAGQVQIIDVRTKESLQIINEERLVEKSKVTCVKWYPGNENLLLSAHISGFMYTYDITSSCSNYTPLYNSQPHKSGDGYSILTVKSKQPSSSMSNSTSSTGTSQNPIYKWVMSTDGSGVHAFEFSPCSRFVAVVTQNGYLRVIDHNNFELYGYMKSYFGGLLTCSWSPDGRFIVTGGEDDLVTVWSFCQQCVVARGNGHRSWISSVAFDPFCCNIPSDDDMKEFYGLSSVNDIISARTSYDFSTSRSNSTELSLEIGGDTKKIKPNSKESGDSPKDNKPQTDCNREKFFPSPTSAIRRLRTYSNVSRLSRLNIGLDSRAPSLCYRFGSVGQDAQICLWEVDENILYISERQKSCTTTSTEQLTGHSSTDAIIENSPTHVNGGFSSASEHNTEGPQYYTYDKKSGDSLNSLVANSRSSSLGHSLNSTINSTKDLKHSSKTNNISNSLSAIRKFSTTGSHDNARKGLKEHKRNLSLPHFGWRSTLNHSNSSSSKTGFYKKQQVTKQPVKTFGTNLCPILKGTAILEPVVCKKVCTGRMTCLHFKRDCIVTTCQDGYLQLWKRPHADLEVNNPPSSPPAQKQLTENGTVV